KCEIHVVCNVEEPCADIASKRLEKPTQKEASVTYIDKEKNFFVTRFLFSGLKKIEEFN
ncbi:hypothetical protein DSO57_1038378, partial [Entomophthora muscae]